MKRNEKELTKLIRDLAGNLLDDLRNSFETAEYVKSSYSRVYKVLTLLPGYKIEFRKWCKDKRKKYFLVLYKGSNYMMEFDLARVIFLDSRKIKWILNRPTRPRNQKNLKEIGYAMKQIRKADVELLYYQMVLINQKAHHTNLGYDFCINESIDNVKKKFRELIDYTICKDDPNAFERGYFEGRTKESKGLSKSRNSKIVFQRYKEDKFTCQVCKFKLEMKNGKYVIECHHKTPLLKETITKLSDLVCLCPTCHRIAHKRREPFTLEEIKSILRQKKKRVRSR